MKTVYQKINEITKRLGAIHADGYNSNSKYNYIGYEQLNSILRRLLPEVGLCITSEVIKFSETSTETLKKDKWGEKTQQVIRTKVDMKFYITDTETGDTIERLWSGADQDYGGKSGGQAITEAVKRFEMKLFHISSKADKDPDSKDTLVEKDIVPDDLKPAEPSEINPEEAKKKALLKEVSANFKCLTKEGKDSITELAGKSTTVMTVKELEALNVGICSMLEVEKDIAEKAIFNEGTQEAK